jgi:hypothetical protein
VRTWLKSTLALSLLASGCLVHERPDDDASAVTDAAIAVDAALAVDGSIATAPDAADLCARSEVSVGVRVEPVTTDAARCMVTHVDGATLIGVDAAPSDDGLRFHFDFCPNADADCRCDVVVTHVGSDIASTLGPASGLTVALSTSPGFFPLAYLSITKVPTCQCDACPCSEPLYFYAASGPPTSARDVPAPMAFSEGAIVCPDNCSPGGSWMLHARSDTGETDVPGGAQREIGSIHVRSVHDVQVFGPCADCAFCGTHVGAWAAWVSSR